MRFFRRKVKIYLDDSRKTPDGDWLRAYSYDDAIALLTRYRGRVSHMSFDHDLGMGDLLNWDDGLTFDDLAPSGYDVLCWIEDKVAFGDKKICPDLMTIHSANPVGRKNMAAAIDSINRLIGRSS